LNPLGGGTQWREKRTGVPGRHPENPALESPLDLLGRGEPDPDEDAEIWIPAAPS
jgi:hypothetical protein